MSDWTKVTNDEFEVGIEIATLKKGELQIKYAKDIVAKDKEIERLSKEVTKYDELLCERNNEVDRLNNIIIRTTKYVGSLSSKGRGCEIYADIKRNILMELKGDISNE